MTTTMTKRTSTDRASHSTLGDNKKLWHTSAPAAVAKECRIGEAGRGWDAWVKHLSNRKKPQSLAKLLPSKASPLAWNLPDRLAGSDTEQLVIALHGAGKKSSWQEQLEPWLFESAGAAPSESFGLECLALTHALPGLASVISPDLWWNLLELLVSTAQADRTNRHGDTPLTAQLLEGELPLALAYTFPELEPCRGLGKKARRVLSEGPAELLDGEGMPKSADLAWLRPLLACWTRCSAMGDHVDDGSWDDDAEEQFQWLVRQAMRLTRTDGSQAFSTGSAGTWCLDLFKAAMEHGGDDDDWAAAAASLPSRSPFEEDGDADLPDPSENSEWSGLAVLRNDWSRRSNLLAVKYGTRNLEIELNAGREMLLAGTWEFDLTVDGRSISSSDEWEEICWVSDEDVDYLELELALDGDIRLQRQLLLARDDGFLYLSECLLDIPSGKTEFTSRLPLADGITFEAAKETRDGCLKSDKSVASVMPLALPEWRVDPRYGTLSVQTGELQLHHQTTGKNLCCPLFFDLNLRRHTKQRTWRQLTVAESLKTVPHDAAVGYRIQCNKDQWLIYRSLVEPANRTLLGHNLASEFEIGRFTAEGDCEEMLEIE